MLTIRLSKVFGGSSICYVFFDHIILTTRLESERLPQEFIADEVLDCVIHLHNMSQGDDRKFVIRKLNGESIKVKRQRFDEEKSKDKITVKERDYCLCCEKNLKRNEAADHYSGSAHRKRLAKYPVLGQCCKACKSTHANGYTSLENKRLHLDSARHSLRMAVAEGTLGNMQLGENHYFCKDKNWWYCDLCDFFSESDNHENGKRHTAALQRINDDGYHFFIEDPDRDTSSSSVNDRGTSQKAAKTGDWVEPGNRRTFAGFGEGKSDNDEDDEADLPALRMQSMSINPPTLLEELRAKANATYKEFLNINQQIAAEEARVKSLRINGKHRTPLFG